MYIVIRMQLIFRWYRNGNVGVAAVVVGGDDSDGMGLARAAEGEEENR